MKESERRNDTRINVDQAQELKIVGAKKSCVTEDEIRQAVKTAGPMVKDCGKS